MIRQRNELLQATLPFFFHLVMGAFLSITFLSGMLLAAPFGFSITHAAGGEAQFGLQPVLYDPSNPLTKSYFIFDSKPGIVEKSSVRVTNSGTARGSVGLYPVDATTGQTSGAVYLNQKDPRKDVGAWIALGMHQLVLNPGQSQVVPFQITIPGSVRQGQHLGGIVAENLTQQSSSATPTSNKNASSIQITVKNLTIIAVQINLPGTSIEQMTGTGVQAGGQNGYQQLLLGLSNTGTIMLKPQGTLEVSDARGQIVKKVSLKLDTFLPQTAISYPIAITGQALLAGDYLASLTLMYGNNQVLRYSTRFTVSQQQLVQVFGTPSSKTQAPLGLGGADGMQLWQIVLVAGGALALLWVAGSALYRRIVVSKAKRANFPSSQFKRPKF
jgi:Bacterial protein of unknown function (DUF916)/Protein of unknown function C-terminal (DUF3324)